LTQAQVAKTAGTSQQQIDRLEKGGLRRYVDWIRKLSAAVNVPPAALIEPEKFDDTDIALQQLARRMAPDDKARLLRLGLALQEETEKRSAA